MSHSRSVRPAPEQLWLSRPPWLLVARVAAVDPRASPPLIEYDLLDLDGSLLYDRVREVLDASWWQHFQPLVRRVG